MPYRPLLPSITHLTTNRAPHPPCHATCAPFEDPSAPSCPSSPPACPSASHLPSHKLVRTDSYTTGHSMDSYEQSDVPAPHRGARASPSDPAFSSDESGGGKKKFQRSQAPRMRGRSETSLDSDPKKEGGKKDSTTPDDDDEAPPRLCSGPGPATDERGTNERNGRMRGRRQARECAQPEPMFAGAGIDSRMHTQPSTWGEGGGERK